MKQVIYDAAHLEVRDGPDGQKALIITEQPIGPVHIFALPEDIARQIGASLKGEKAIATPPKPQIVVPG